MAAVSRRHSVLNYRTNSNAGAHDRLNPCRKSSSMSSYDGLSVYRKYSMCSNYDSEGNSRKSSSVSGESIAVNRKNSTTSTCSYDSVELVQVSGLDAVGAVTELKLLAETSVARVYSARRGGTNVALKCFDKQTTKRQDFCRELHLHHSLEAHPNLVTCLSPALETPTEWALAQELAPDGDLAHLVGRTGVGQAGAKLVAQQVALALRHMHKNQLVHRDVCLENILVFERDLSQVKLGDLGSCRAEGALVKKAEVRCPWAPPEVCQAVQHEGYHVHSGQDAWQLGVLIFVCLTGSYPWAAADITDQHYNTWLAWLRRRCTKTPPRFRAFSPRLLRLLRRLLEPKSQLRSGVKEVHKYLADSWLVNDKENDNNGQESGVWSILSKTERKLSGLLRSYTCPLDQPSVCHSPRRVRFADDEDKTNDGSSGTGAVRCPAA